MNLDPTQRSKVANWIEQGLKLSEIQSRLSSEFGLTLTYMDVRLLVDDLKLTPKDPDPPKPVTPPAASAPLSDAPVAPPADAPGLGGVSVSVDQLTRPGSLVSGKVVFSDGQKAEWYMDQTGRLGLAPQQPGYRPPQDDVRQFQVALEAELSKMGL